MHIASEEEFDRDLALHELLAGINMQQLADALVAILGPEVRLVDETGNCVIGAEQGIDGGMRMPVTVELEPIAYIEGRGSTEQLQAAVFFIQQMLRSASRYYMASKIHIQTVYADYEKLQLKHAQLVESESRFKELASHLEERVNEQVKVIDTTQRQLYQAEKMASVGQLAAGVAHEINNPIGFVRSNLATAHSYIEKISYFAGEFKSDVDKAALLSTWRDVDLDYVLQDFLGLINESIDGIDRVAKIVIDLKHFSNVDGSEEEITDLNEHIRSLCHVVTGQLSARAAIKMDLTKLPITRCHPGHVSQAIMNLILNAAGAMDTLGEITVSTRTESTQTENAEIRIQVSDTGRGIHQDIIDKVFDPFFTTNAVGNGTGLGLTVTRDIIAAHDGRIEIKSEIGVGTDISLFLPVKD